MNKISEKDNDIIIKCLSEIVFSSKRNGTFEASWKLNLIPSVNDDLSDLFPIHNIVIIGDSFITTGFCFVGTNLEPVNIKIAIDRTFRYAKDV